MCTIVENKTFLCVLIRRPMAVKAAAYCFGPDVCLGRDEFV